MHVGVNFDTNTKIQSASHFSPVDRCVCARVASHYARGRHDMASFIWTGKGKSYETGVGQVWACRADEMI